MALAEDPRLTGGQLPVGAGYVAAGRLAEAFGGYLEGAAPTSDSR